MHGVYIWRLQWNHLGLSVTPGQGCRSSRVAIWAACGGPWFFSWWVRNHRSGNGPKPLSLSDGSNREPRLRWDRYVEMVRHWLRTGFICIATGKHFAAFLNWIISIYSIEMLKFFRGDLGGYRDNVINLKKQQNASPRLYRRTPSVTKASPFQGTYPISGVVLSWNG